MCHQSIGLIARRLEAAGFPTIGITSARTITAAVKPPRSVFFDAPLGHTAGPPHDPARQREIVRSALDLGVAISEPGDIVDLELRWHHDDWKSAPLEWSRRGEEEPKSGPRSGPADTRTARSPSPQYQNEADRHAAESVDPDEQCRTCIGISGPVVDDRSPDQPSR